MRRNRKQLGQQAPVQGGALPRRRPASRRSLGAQLGLMVLCLAAFCLMATAVDGWRRRAALGRRWEEVRRRRDQLQRRCDELALEVDRRRNDPLTIELLLRRDLHWMEEGEFVVSPR